MAKYQAHEQDNESMFTYELKLCPGMMWGCGLGEVTLVLDPGPS